MINAYNLIVDKLTLWLKEFIKLLPNIALAALVLVLGFFVARWLKTLIGKLIRKMVSNETLENLFTSLVHIFLLGVTVFIALSVFNLIKL